MVQNQQFHAVVWNCVDFPTAEIGAFFFFFCHSVFFLRSSKLSGQCKGMHMSQRLQLLFLRWQLWCFSQWYITEVLLWPTYLHARGVCVLYTNKKESEKVRNWIFLLTGRRREICICLRVTCWSHYNWRIGDSNCIPEKCRGGRRGGCAQIKEAKLAPVQICT